MSRSASYSLRGKDAVAENWAAKARAAEVLPSNVMGFPLGSEAYEKWADAVFRPTWRKLGLAEWESSLGTADLSQQRVRHFLA